MRKLTSCGGLDLELRLCHLNVSWGPGAAQEGPMGVPEWPQRGIPADPREDEIKVITPSSEESGIDHHIVEYSETAQDEPLIWLAGNNRYRQKTSHIANRGLLTNNMGSFIWQAAANSVEIIDDSPNAMHAHKYRRNLSSQVVQCRGTPSLGRTWEVLLYNQINVTQMLWLSYRISG